MYDKDKIIEKVNQAKKDLIIKKISEINEELINHYINENRDFDKYKKLCSNYFDKELSDLVESVILKDKDITSITKLLAMYYKKFKTIFMCYSDNNIISNGILNIDEIIIDLNLIRRIITVPYEEWVEQHQFFDDFNRMTTSFENIKLANSDKFYIVMETIWKNINAGLLECESGCDINFFSLSSGQMNGFDENEVIDIISDDKYKYLLEKNNNELSDLELRQKNVLISSKEILEEKIDFDIDKLKGKYEDLKKHYFNKIDENGKFINLNKDDVKIVIATLKKLGVTDKFASIAQRILTKEVVKEVKSKSKYSFVNSTKFSKKLINDKEYKAIRNEIKEYFDMHDGKVVRPLTEEETLYCANLMLKIGEDKLVRTLFDRTKQHEKNPISRYVREYDKLKYYESRLGIEQEIEDMEIAFQNMILSSDEDYNILKSMLDEDLRTVESLLPSSYEYEMNKAKEYKKSSIY